jgi:hypothetical protein
VRTFASGGGTLRVRASVPSAPIGGRTEQPTQDQMTRLRLRTRAEVTSLERGDTPEVGRRARLIALDGAAPVCERSHLTGSEERDGGTMVRARPVRLRPPSSRPRRAACRGERRLMIGANRRTETRNRGRQHDGSPLVKTRGRVSIATCRHGFTARGQPRWNLASTGYLARLEHGAARPFRSRA